MRIAVKMDSSAAGKGDGGKRRAWWGAVVHAKQIARFTDVKVFFGGGKKVTGRGRRTTGERYWRKDP